MSPQPYILAIFQSLSAPQVIVVGIVALLIFWRRPLEVAGRLTQPSGIGADTR